MGSSHIFLRTRRNSQSSTKILSLPIERKSIKSGKVLQ